MSDDQGDNQRDGLDELASDQEQETADEFTLEAFYDEAKARIRFVQHQGEPWYSVIDVIGLLTDSTYPNRYWSDMKQRLADEEGFREVYAKCVRLKMLAPDGKQRLTDAANEETLLRLIQSIPSPKAEPFKQWLARVGHEHLEEARNPELGADRMRKQYQAMGYTDEWIGVRLRSIMVRDELTNEWRARGAKEGKQFGALTETTQRRTFDISTAEHKQVKNLPARANLRDSMTGLELAFTILGEEAAKELHQTHDSQGFDELLVDAQEAGDVAGAARRDLETRTGRPVVSGENYKTLRQGRLRELQAPLFPDEEPGKPEE